MKLYNSSDFEKNEAWLVFRFDMKIADNFHDLYLLMHLPSQFIMGHEIVEHDIEQQHIDKLFKHGARHGNIPNRVLLAKGDPIEDFLKIAAAKFSMQLETVPSASLDNILLDARETFGSTFLSPSTIGYLPPKADDDEFDSYSAKMFIPDSYDPCPCASGKKYKFCCKKIFEEVTNAMVAAEDGHKQEAIKWIEKAKALVGETSEVLCRESIVYSFFDNTKSLELLEKCLTLYPEHPRSHYIHAINLEESGDFEGAILSYKKAISHYPDTDHFHLNEAYNNLGTVFHQLGDLGNAKIAWEKALIYLPTDKMTQENLRDFIYHPQGKNKIF